MTSLLPTLTLFATSVFLLALLMNLVRKNTTMITLYLLQSLVITFALLMFAYESGAVGLFAAALLTLLVKVAMAPAFLFRMIKKYSAHFSASSYLNIPLSLLALAAIAAFSYSFITPGISPLNESQNISLLLATIFSALFLMVNRRGAVAAIIGVLSLENGVVLLATFLGVEQPTSLEFAIAFDIAVWVAIATIFLAMMYRQFGVVDTASLSMTRLTEE